jgi:hypothetical protein
MTEIELNSKAGWLQTGTMGGFQNNNLNQHVTTIAKKL